MLDLGAPIGIHWGYRRCRAASALSPTHPQQTHVSRHVAPESNTAVSCGLLGPLWLRMSAMTVRTLPLGMRSYVWAH